MKLKLLQQNNIALLAERYDDSIKIYFGDGHSEVSDERIEDYFKNKSRMRYKTPIEIYGQMLYPIKDQKEKDCIWINVDYLDSTDRNYILMLKNKNIFDKAIKMFLKQKEIQLKMLR